ncbi:FecR domain-containing protein [Chitinophaga sedimenti]|uniref:FecR family protein n=1 Tax=Chitinophaga sedimenti TaxID=2033606 RepID=UPI002002F3F1|nr:FecR family protein [Chitinophaga sedimenti]MCK7553694.1 FecR domain-containing protein [Chitinophaga sedimenti]
MKQQEFYDLLKDPAQRDLLTATFLELTGDADLSLPMNPALLPILDNVMKTDKPQPVLRVRRLYQWGWAAAAVLLLAAGGTYWMLAPHNNHPQTAAYKSLKEVKPGGDGAILTLANGQKVVLDSTADGVIAEQHGAEVVLKDNEVSYAGTAQETSINTISTPKGKQFRVQLPDGSKVWLNAASSIVYPTAFTGSHREVEITGEVYFEIAQNAQQPFRVKFGKRSIDVLGTAFNINAYADEPVAKATLLSGSIRINQEKIMTPGQQAVIDNSNDQLTVTNDLDTNDEIAWKNGLFVMRSTDLPALLRQLSRWYDIDIRVQGQLPKREFGGKLTKDMDLAAIMEVLSAYGIHSRLERGTLIIF